MLCKVLIFFLKGRTTFSFAERVSYANYLAEPNRERSRAAAVINAYQRHPLSSGADKSLTKIFQIAPRAFLSKRNKVRQRRAERKNERKKMALES